MFSKTKESVGSWISTIFWLALGLGFFGCVPINLAYGCSIWVGGNLTYGNDLTEAISAFDAGNTAAAESLLTKAAIDAENYPLAIGPDAGNDLAKRAENLGSKALKDEASYARAALLLEYAQGIRSKFSERKAPWLFETYFWLFNNSKKATAKTHINTARALNLAKKGNDAEPILLELSSELLSNDSRSLVSKTFVSAPKNATTKLSRDNLQYLVLCETELIDVNQQKGHLTVADEHARRVLELCKEKRVWNETLKMCAKRLKEMGREADALVAYEEMQNTHRDRDDDND